MQRYYANIDLESSTNLRIVNSEYLSVWFVVFFIFQGITNVYKMCISDCLIDKNISLWKLEVLQWN